MNINNILQFVLVFVKQLIGAGIANELIDAQVLRLTTISRPFHDRITQGLDSGDKETAERLRAEMAEATKNYVTFVASRGENLPEYDAFDFAEAEKPEPKPSKKKGGKNEDSEPDGN